jgi:hypothetical protein
VLQGNWEWFIGMRETHCEELTDMLVHEAIVDHPAYLAHGDNMLIAQDPQLMGNGGIITAQSCSQITHTQFSRRSMQQGVEDLEPGWVGKDGKEVRGDTSSIGRKKVSSDCQGMFRMNTTLVTDIELQGVRRGWGFCDL